MPNTPRSLALLLAASSFTLPVFAQSGATAKLRFVPVTPCRVIDTREGSSPAAPLFAQTRVVPVAGTCGVPPAAKAFSLNVTAVPLQSLSFLTIWPTGEAQPFASLLNSWSGAIVAAASLTKAGVDGSVSVFTTDPTHLVIDVNGYFVEATTELAYFPLKPCRVLDSRIPGAPLMFPAGATRTVTPRGVCGVPATAQAYALNFTVVVPQVLGFLTAWPTGASRPLASTLNAPRGGLVANAAIVPAGTNGGIDVFVTDNTEVVIDVNGYFAPPTEKGIDLGGLSLVVQNVCRVADTRIGEGKTGTVGPPNLVGNEGRLLRLREGNCPLPPPSPTAKPERIAFVLNATVVPPGPLGFLTLWPALLTRPETSTVNTSFSGSAVSNMAIVEGQAFTSEINVFAADPTALILDLNGYFIE